MQITGKWYRQGSAAQLNAELRVDGDTYKILVSDDEHRELLSGLSQDINVTDRLGNVERKLILPDGSVFATSNNDAIDQAFSAQTKLNRFIHTLESHIAFVLFSIVFTVLFAFGFFKYGVPWISSTIAHALPHKTNEIIAASTLDFLDEYIFEPSKLEPARILAIRKHVEENILPLDQSGEPIKYTLHFREWTHGKTSIPNALALPSGDIILTDKFVQLSQNQNEIDSVLLHEMGHVVERHSLKMIIESTIVTTAVMVITGDSTTAADMGIGIGSLLVSSNYSRGHESQADQYAFQHMLKAGINPQAFSNIMARITQYDGDESHEPENTPIENSHESNNSVLDYLSTHPSTSERIEEAQRYQKCFEAGLVVCDKN